MILAWKASNSDVCIAITVLWKAANPATKVSRGDEAGSDVNKDANLTAASACIFGSVGDGKASELIAVPARLAASATSA